MFEDNSLTRFLVANLVAAFLSACVHWQVRDFGIGVAISTGLIFSSFAAVVILVAVLQLQKVNLGFLPILASIVTVSLLPTSLVAGLPFLLDRQEASRRLTERQQNDPSNRRNQ